jgi:arabinan endo-1,5-alpha-L-arabinosidase
MHTPYVVTPGRVHKPQPTEAMASTATPTPSGSRNFFSAGSFLRSSRSLFTAAVLAASCASSASAAFWNLSGTLTTHDPSIVKQNTTWWIFETGQGLPVKWSSNGLAWNQGVRLFNAEKSWWRTWAPNMGSLDVWAPDVHYFNGRYWVYYSVSEFGKNNSAIGLVSCSSIAAGDWRDDGFVIGSKSGTNSYNCIDPSLTIDASGQPWLVFGSWFSGLYVTRLSTSTMKPTGSLYNIAKRTNGIEGGCIVYRNGYYYLFASIDKCCNGVNSTYKIGYGRSTSITGPYTDKSGGQLLSGSITVLDAGNVRWKGPGGQDVYQNGSAWVIARHAYDANNNGTPTLLINDLYFDSSNWPTY